MRVDVGDAAALYLGFSTQCSDGFAPATTMFNSNPWPQFLGEFGTGISDAMGLPRQWSARSGVSWQQPLPGIGSSPLVTSRRIHITSQTEQGRLHVTSYDREHGQPIPNGELPENLAAELERRDPRQRGCTASAVADDHHLWVMVDSSFACLTADGRRLVWYRNLCQQFGETVCRHDSSLRMHGDLLYSVLLANGSSWVAAFEKSTGRRVWSSLMGSEQRCAFHSMFQSHRGREILLVGRDDIRAYHLGTGAQRWHGRCSFDGEPRKSASSHPIIVACAGPSGQNGLPSRVIALRYDCQSPPLWQHEALANGSPPVVLDGLAYCVSETGMGSCIEIASGEICWQRQFAVGTYVTPTVVGDGMVFFLNRSGECTVVQADRQGEPISTNAMGESDEEFTSAPAIADGSLFFRSDQRLIAVCNH
jgi:outer membrane protein assembly factor BamB